ncbi:hypothetical protein ACS0TY_010752 [Phlomoides rotata]
MKLSRRKDEETSTSKVTALIATTAESNQAAESDDDQDELALFIKQFKKFVKGRRTTWKKGQSKPTAEGKDLKVPKMVILMDICVITPGSLAIS